MIWNFSSYTITEVGASQLVQASKMDGYESMKAYSMLDRPRGVTAAEHVQLTSTVGVVL